MARDVYEAYCRESNTFQGWVETGFFQTLPLLDELLQANAVAGPVAEIGVHCGKLLLAMLLVGENPSPAVVLDNFENGLAIREKLEANIRRFYDPALVTILNKDSMQANAADFLDRLPSRPRFFSVDGYHQVQFVTNDLLIAQDVIATGGIVIVDDYPSPAWPGVQEAVYKLLHEAPVHKIAPFAYGKNKLLLTTLLHRQRYFEHFRALDGRHVARIGGYECSYFMPDEKWFAYNWDYEA